MLLNLRGLMSRLGEDKPSVRDAGVDLMKECLRQWERNGNDMADPENQDPVFLALCAQVQAYYWDEVSAAAAHPPAQYYQTAIAIWLNRRESQHVGKAYLYSRKEQAWVANTSQLNDETYQYTKDPLQALPVLAEMSVHHGYWRVDPMPSDGRPAPGVVLVPLTLPPLPETSDAT